MESPLSPTNRSPGPPICKVTYLERKRKRTVSQPDNSDSDSSAKSISPASSPMKSNPNSPKKDTNSPRKAGSKVPASRGPKKVDVPLPGPSPIKRARRDSDEPTDIPTGRKGMHIRAASSISSLKQVAQNVTDSPSAGKKPESSVSRKPKSKKAKSIAASEDFDDNISVADSAVSSKIRRNESERIEYYKNQPECGKAEPHSALCSKCNKSVNLGRKQTYAVRPWEIHRARCDQKPAIAVMTTPKASEDSMPASQAINMDSPSQFLASTSHPTPARRLTESERKEFLETEKQIKVVEKNRVCCRKCQKWIDLSPVHAYVTSNWVKHKIRCSEAIPSDRVAAAKRKLRVVNDTQVKSFSPRSIECGFCGIIVQLVGDGEFNLTNWDEHKSDCTRSVSIFRSDSVNSVTFPTSSRPPASSASTEGTVVVDPAVTRSSKGLKRAREGPDVIPQEDARPAIRPRKAGYLPPDMDPPTTVMGWFLLPFHSFVRGFKEGLKDRN